MATEYVRVHDKSTGYNLTIPAARFNPDLYAEVEDESALDRHGDPAEPNYHPVRRETPRHHERGGTKSSRSAKASESGKDGQQEAETPEEEN